MPKGRRRRLRRPKLRLPKRLRKVKHGKGRPWSLEGRQTVNIPGLKRWFQDLWDWGCLVREDIVRLEQAAYLAQGDPGDPPPPPQD